MNKKYSKLDKNININIKTPSCPSCLFCEKILNNNYIRCNNADVAYDTGWGGLYMQQGYLDLPYLFNNNNNIIKKNNCCWFVQKNKY